MSATLQAPKKWMTKYKGFIVKTNKKGSTYAKKEL